VPIDVAPAEMLCSARMHTPSFASSRGALHSSSGLDIAMDGSQSQSSSTSIFFVCYSARLSISTLVLFRLYYSCAARLGCEKQRSRFLSPIAPREYDLTSIVEYCRLIKKKLVANLQGVSSNVLYAFIGWLSGAQE